MKNKLYHEAVSVLESAECLFSPIVVDEILDAMALKITQDYHDKNPVILCVMKGGLYFTSELLKRFSFLLQFDYIHVTRYQNGISGGGIEWRVKPEIQLENRHVLILDDILDQGLTIQAIHKAIEEQACASIATAVLVKKIHQDKNFAVAQDVEYIGVNVPDRYVFGCGMDYKSYHRNLIGIYAVADKSE